MITIPQSINAVASKESSKDLPQLLHEYNDIFQGIGKLKDFQFEIHVDSEVQPVAQPERRIPFHIRQQVDQEINNLEKQGIIEVVEGSGVGRSIIGAGGGGNIHIFVFCIINFF